MNASTVAQKINLRQDLSRAERAAWALSERDGEWPSPEAVSAFLEAQDAEKLRAAIAPKAEFSKPALNSILAEVFAPEPAVPEGFIDTTAPVPPLVTESVPARPAKKGLTKGKKSR